MPFTPVLPRKSQIAVQSSVSLRHRVRIREQNCQVTLLADNRLSSTTAKIRPSDCACHLSGIRLGFYRVHPARARPLVAPRNFAPAGEEGAGSCAPAVTRLLRAPLPDGLGTRGCVSFGAVLLSRGGGEESSPAPFRTKRKT